MELIKGVVVDYRELSDAVEEPVSFNRVLVRLMQELLGELSEECVKSIIEKTTGLRDDSRDRVIGIMNSKGHIKRHLTKLLTRYISRVLYTNAVFCSAINLAREYNCFQLF